MQLNLSKLKPSVLTWSWLMVSLSLTAEESKPLQKPSLKSWQDSSFTGSNTGSNPFQKAVSRGKTVRYPIVKDTLPNSKFRAGIDPKKVEVKQDKACQCIGWTRFNTKFQAKVASSDLKTYALKFLDENFEEFKLASADLVEAERFVIEPNDSLKILTFTRNHQNIPVEDAYVQFIFQKHQDGSYRLAEYVNRSYGTITLATKKLSDMTPQSVETISGLKDVEIIKQFPVIYANNQGDSYQFVQGTHVDFQSASDDIKYSAIIQAETNQILEATNNRFEAPHTLKSRTYDRSYVFNDLKEFTLPFINVNGALTNSIGFIDTDATSLNITLDGVARVYTFNNFNAPVAFTVPTGANGVTVVDGTNVSLSALNAFSGVARIYKYVRQFLTPTQVPFFNQPINVVVDINEECNAFFNPGNNSINFFAASDTCGNTALVNDIVYHEWGHALDFATGTVAGITDGAFSEGIGDIVSVLLSRNANVGPGFRLNQASPPVRTLDNNMQYDPNADLEVHIEGQIIGGSFWDFRQNMIASYGEEEGHRKAADIFLKHLLSTDTYTDSFAAFLRLNDDDQNPATPSPDECKIRQAFARHNLTQTDPTCIDTDAGIKVRIKDGSAPKSVTLEASSFGAREIYLCQGDVMVCTPESTGYQLLSAEEKAESDNRTKLFYKNTANTELTISEGDTYTLMSTNPRGDVVGRRVLEFNRGTDI